MGVQPFYIRIWMCFVNLGEFLFFWNIFRGNERMPEKVASLFSRKIAKSFSYTKSTTAADGRRL